MAKSKKTHIAVKFILAFAAVLLVATGTWGCKRTDFTALGVKDTRSMFEDDYEYVVISDDIPSQMIHYPGFSMSFNPIHHQPNYVVWELTGQEVRRNVVGKRQNKFAPDTHIEGCASLDDYRRSGYDRGHMAPAGDMRWSTEASDASFLLTNMSPQNHDLNTGAWRVLEEKCRDWAVRDSAIVIVCGPVLTDKITRTVGNTGVSVPERYFKVILSPYTNPPRAIGFVMPNTNVMGGIQTTAMSVDEVEAITGFDFFSSLPDNVEDVIEAENKFSKWSYRTDVNYR